MTRRSTVWGFKEARARARQVTTVAGVTSIKVRGRIAAHDVAWSWIARSRKLTSRTDLMALLSL